MKKFSVLIYFILGLPILLVAQLKHDYVWPFGFGKIKYINGAVSGGMLLDFNTTPPQTSLHDFISDFPFASIADKNGNLIAYTDGCRLFNKNNLLMLNGDTLNPGKVYDIYCSFPNPQFYPIIQPCIFLPKPESDSLYYLFHLRSDNKYKSPMNLLFSEIDASKDNGKGAVISKSNVLLSDSLYLGDFISATRHANGRDWWVVVTRRLSNDMHVTLVTPDTVQYMGIQDVGFAKIDTAYCCNQTRFSPDGGKFFRNYPAGMLILDFDRCNGTFSNPVHWDYNIVPKGSGGVAVSPNSRFLYLCSGITVQQYDLEAPDVLASREIVAVYDGFLSPLETYFFHAQLAPDGKIYILTPNNGYVLHVIHHPNKKGLACNVEQHGLILPARCSHFEPNFPNYRLGPIDGSACDTLGIDNLPVAQFLWELQDTLSPQQIEFTDLSYFKPATWFWNFGDGVTSQDTSPIHIYAAPGTYTACLTVCNPHACDTSCQLVQVEAVNTVTLAGDGGQILLWPNPVGNLLNLQAPQPFAQVKIFSAMGKEVLSLISAKELESIDVHQLPSGLYFISIQAGGKLWSGKFVKAGG